MKLYLNATSPFSRLAVVAAKLTENLPLSLVWVEPWDNPDSLLAVNPLGQIPALELDEGAISESLAICQYFQMAGQEQRLSLPQSPQEFAQLGLAKGLMELSFRFVALSRFHPQAGTLHQRSLDGVSRAVARLNQDWHQQPWPPQTSLSQLVLLVALDYLQLRLPEQHQQLTPELTSWCAEHPLQPALQHVSLEWLATQPAVIS